MSQLPLACCTQTNKSKISLDYATPPQVGGHREITVFALIIFPTILYTNFEAMSECQILTSLLFSVYLTSCVSKRFIAKKKLLHKVELY